MGNLRHLDLDKWIQKYNLRYFFETGTQHGQSVACAAAYPFVWLGSVEINPECYFVAVKNLQHVKRVSLFLGSSMGVLPSVLKKLKGNTLFWLDAHFPEGEEHAHDMSYFDKETAYPLESELDFLYRTRKEYKDVIICDDWRFYEDLDYEEPLSNINRNNLYIGTGDFLKKYEDLWDKEVLLQEGGYLILTPKDDKK